MIVSEKEIPKIVEHLKSQGLAALPTETVYGLAGNALKEESILSIFKLKNRPKFDPLIVHIKDVSELNKYAIQPIPKAASLLTQKYWPGPLTIVLPKTALIPDVVTSGLPFCAFRMPQHPLFQKILRQLDFPLAAPSANPFGYVSPTNAKHVAMNLDVPFILDGGPAKHGLESTIIGFVEKGKALLLRHGSIPHEEIDKLVPGLLDETSSKKSPQSPGQLDKHYATRKKLYLIEDLKSFKIKETDGLICFGHVPHKGKNVFNLSANGDFIEAGKNLFSMLHLLDNHSGINQIFALKLPNIGLGKAINDRLERAEKN